MRERRILNSFVIKNINMGILKGLFSSKGRGKNTKEQEIKKDEEKIKAKIINIRKVFEEIEKAKKVVIIEDSEIREALAYFISKKYPEKEIYTAETVKEATELIENVVDKDTVVYLDNMIKNEKEGIEVEFGARVQNHVSIKAGFSFICSNDEAKYFSIGYLPKADILKYLREEKGQEPLTINKEEFLKEVDKAEKIVLIDDDEAYLRMFSRALETRFSGKEDIVLKSGEEIDRVIEERKINNRCVILLDNEFPYSKSKEQLGRVYYWKLMRITEAVFINSGDDANNFRGMRYLGKDNLTAILMD